MFNAPTLEIVTETQEAIHAMRKSAVDRWVQRCGQIFITDAREFGRAIGYPPELVLGAAQRAGKLVDGRVRQTPAPPQRHIEDDWRWLSNGAERKSFTRSELRELAMYHRIPMRELLARAERESMTVYDQ